MLETGYVARSKEFIGEQVQYNGSCDFYVRNERIKYSLYIENDDLFLCNWKKSKRINNKQIATVKGNKRCKVHANIQKTIIKALDNNFKADAHYFIFVPTNYYEELSKHDD